MKRIVRWSICILVATAILFTVLYICLFAIPFMGNEELTEEFTSSVNVDDYYGGGTSERVRLLDDPQESFTYRMNLIEQAQEEIVFSSYSTTDGNTTRIFLGALLKKADEGVSVKIVLDGKFAGLTKEAEYAFTANENVELYIYNEASFFHPTKLNACMHDKYLIVDGEYMLFGGRNVGDFWYGDESYSGDLTLDREVFVYGGEASDNGAISQVRDYFEQIISEDVCVLKDGLSDKKREKGENYAAELVSITEEYYSEKSASIDYTAETVAVNKITLITNPTHAGRKEARVGYILYRLAASSDKVFLQSPYVTLDAEHLSYLTGLTQTCNVTLLTNSIGTTPNLPAYSNYYVRRKNLVESGIDIYEYQSEDSSIHAKTYLFGDRLTAIGSFNLDERSMEIDTESMLIIDGEKFQDNVKETLATYISTSLQVGEDNKYIEDKNVTETKASFIKKAVYGTAGTLLRPFVSLL
ncbi:MAG: phospholipase D-like domain-containing protein [Clostridia bacterium]|nr:phospholipase D-like domain-containing protein [Clostridia bacterium]